MEQETNQGWIKLHRKTQESWIYPHNKPFTNFEAWIDLLLNANHKDKKVLLKNELYLCKRGDQLRSLQTLSERWQWSRSKVRRFFDLLQSDSMVVLKPDQKTTQITICNYDVYQGDRNTDETQTDIERTSNEHQTDINKNDKNDNNANNDKKEETGEPVNASEIIAYLNEKTGKSFKANSRQTLNLIKARLNEGFKQPDFIKVINNKAATWKDDPKMNGYLRPLTLFGTKFEAYLNEEIISKRGTGPSCINIEHQDHSLSLNDITNGKD